MTTKNAPKTENVNTLALKIGDVVQTHGGRFELTEFIVDERRAWDDAHASVGYTHAEKAGPDELAKYLEREINVRSFRTKFLGPVREGREPAIGRSARHEWTIQGNHLRMWTREVVEKPAQVSGVDPAELYVRGVEWIALYDETAFATDGTVVKDSRAIGLLSHAHGLSTEHVARDVGEVRAQAGRVLVEFGKAYPAQAAQAVDAANRTDIQAAEWKVEGSTRDPGVNYYTKAVDHGVQDDKRRELGHYVTIVEKDGAHAVRIQSTRNGKDFGAYNTNTQRVEGGLDAAKQVADEKLFAARKRVVREFGQK